MVPLLRPIMLDIDLSILRQNLVLARNLAGDREVIASIKANAYGFGAVGISRALVAAGVRKLWTGNLGEAIAIRQDGIEAEIILFGGAEPHQFEAVLQHDLQPTIFDQTGIDALARAAAAGGRRAPVWIKVDAGLGRLGVPVDGALAFVQRVCAIPELDLRGVYTHLPFATHEGKRWALERYALFGRLLKELESRGIDPPVRQVWGSSGVLAGLPDICNAVCVGHLLYGLSPLRPEVAELPGLASPIRALSASILHVNDTGPASDAGAGYGGKGNGLAATVAIGLGDGLRKAVPGAAHVLVGAKPAPIKAFTLEHLMIDISDSPRPELFDRAVVIGASGALRISLDDWAEWTGASPLEFMMSLSGRTPVTYLDPPEV